eukprot:TRINITY_DN53510_c0_g1_i1.p1 TRINITY_DN53510_c0_g1~~TRINITY_DN53510_c0_g1_i1.p1  ORF type:complete len:335 (-),score=61.15 TRINITY_DN53510_c0_g1_i1:104-1108(-)
MPPSRLMFAGAFVALLLVSHLAAAERHKLLVLGGTSVDTGLHIVRGLVDEGFHLLVLTRNASAIEGRLPWQVTLASGSMLSVEDVAAAAQTTPHTSSAGGGVDAIFLITPRGNPEREVEAAQVAVEASKRAGLSHVIFASSIVQRHPETAFSESCRCLAGKPRVEELLDKSGLSWTSIRTGIFMEDFFANQGKKIFKDGAFSGANPSAMKLHLTARADVARATTRILSQAITGPLNVIDPKAYTGADMLDMLSMLREKTVKGPWFNYLPRLLWMASKFTWIFGLPEKVVVIFEFLACVYSAPLVADVKRQNGFQGATTLKSWCKKHLLPLRDEL